MFAKLFQGLSIPRRFLIFVLGTVIALVIMFATKHFYDNRIQKRVINELSAKTTKAEEKSIEKIKQIRRDNRQLSSDEHTERMSQNGDFREPADYPHRQQNERMRGLSTPQDVPQLPSQRHRTSGRAQYDSSSSMWSTSQIQNGLNPCKVVFGFDHNNRIIQTEVCDDAR